MVEEFHFPMESAVTGSDPGDRRPGRWVRAAGDVADDRDESRRGKGTREKSDRGLLVWLEVGDPESSSSRLARTVHAGRWGISPVADGPTVSPLEVIVWGRVLATHSAWCCLRSQPSRDAWRHISQLR